MSAVANSSIEAGELVRAEARLYRAWGVASFPSSSFEVLPGERARPREERRQSKERASTRVDILCTKRR